MSDHRLNWAHLKLTLFALLLTIELFERFLLNFVLISLEVQFAQDKKDLEKTIKM